MLAHDVSVITGLRPPRRLRGEVVITAGLTDPPDPAGGGRDSVSPAKVQHTWQVVTGLGVGSQAEEWRGPTSGDRGGPRGLL